MFNSDEALKVIQSNNSNHHTHLPTKPHPFLIHRLVMERKQHSAGTFMLALSMPVPTYSDDEHTILYHS